MTKKAWIRIGIVIIITCVMCFSDWSFADDGEDMLWSISSILSILVSILSWFWVVFAKLAGEFLTNKWVYGEIIGLDKLLWSYRVMVRNIANFGLGFYFVYKVFIVLIKKEGLTKDIKNVLLWILIAGVGIQASRFVTAAMIDVSTITLVAVGSLPAQITSKTPAIEEGLRKSLSDYVDQNFNVTTGLELRLFPQNGNIIENILIPTENTKTKEEIVDALVPSADDVSGPLYYIGFSLLEANILNSMDNSDGNAVKKTIINVIIQGGTTVVYAIEMFILCILALIRIVYLWMFIILSPLAILLRCIGKADKNLGDKISGEKGFLSSLTKHINISSFIINIFKPAIIILGVGLAMIFAVLMSGIINKNGDKSINENIGGVQIMSYEDGNEQNKTYTTTIHSDLFSYTIRHVGKGLLDFIVSIMTVIVVYFIIKIAAGMGGGKDFVSTKIKKVQDSLEKLMGSIPFVPVPGYDEQGVPTRRYINANNIFGLGGKDGIIGGTMSNFQRKIDSEYNRQEEVIQGLFGDKTGYLSASEEVRLQNAMSGSSIIDQLINVKNIINEIKTKEGKGMTLDMQTAKNQGLWINQFSNWLTGMSGKESGINGNASFGGDKNKKAWIKAIKKWNDEDENWKNKSNQEKMKDLFENYDFARAYADFFDLDKDMRVEYILRADISKRNE